MKDWRGSRRNLEKCMAESRAVTRINITASQCGEHREAGSLRVHTDTLSRAE